MTFPVISLYKQDRDKCNETSKTHMRCVHSNEDECNMPKYHLIDIDYYNISIRYESVTTTFDRECDLQCEDVVCFLVTDELLYTISAFTA